MFLGETTISDEKRKQLTESFEFLEKFLENSEWFAGDSLTLADLAILSSISSIVHVGADLSQYSKLSSWYEKCKTLPGFGENDEGAKVFGLKVKGNLTESL